MVCAGKIELPSTASEAVTLSIELRALANLVALNGVEPSFMPTYEVGAKPLGDSAKYWRIVMGSNHRIVRFKT